MNASHARLSWFLRVTLFAAIGVALGAFLLTRPTLEALHVVGLLALWMFLGIPACCGLKG